MRLRLSCSCSATFDCEAATTLQLSSYHDAFVARHAECITRSDDGPSGDGAAPDVVSHQGASVSGALEQTPDLIGAGFWRDPEENGEDARRRIGFGAA